MAWGERQRRVSEGGREPEYINQERKSKRRSTFGERESRIQSLRTRIQGEVSGERRAQSI